jgi:UDP-N-acetylglucosamine--N-acetylmuramyl-(pentapeptide) pyrophosphoryl-undecaprenol N-acetylglucosamine transferase
MILGGSQGSAPVNACVVKSLPLFAADLPGLRFIHQTGERDYNGVRQAYAEQGIAAEVYAFIDQVAEAFGRADLVISRAGALTVAELAAAGKAAVLIPFAAAADQHQLENARALERMGAACVIVQSELTPPGLVATVCELLRRPARLREMEQRARSLATPEAAARIADLIEEIAR